MTISRSDSWREKADAFASDLPISADLFSKFADDVDNLGEGPVSTERLITLALSWANESAIAVARVEALARGLELNIAEPSGDLSE
ncbi:MULTISPECIES: hypothetical protein [Corynebacterium]|uniref:hypothetical protein n=1 Tax=Corynebacterium TaxID=1716 RepID=UPI000407B77C|nr:MULTISPECIES: hypothetical protein [Corynebacterium]MCT1410011.1 hypothetical protein [Corynebacterium accolens]